MRDAVITNAQIVLCDEVISGSVAIRDGKISAIDRGSTAVPQALDFGGDFLIPGLVELHTDNLERHSMPRPKSYWPVKSAVLNHDKEVTAAGITTVFDALTVGYHDQDTRPNETFEAMALAISDLHDRGSLKSEHFLHWRCEISGDHMWSGIEHLSQNKRTGLYSIMDHTPGQRQFMTLESYYTYYQGKYNLTDAEMEVFISRRKEAQERNAAVNRRRVVELANSQNLPLASHDDATIEHVDEAIDDGIVVAEFPTTREAAKASHENNLAVLLGAPNVVRGKSHSGNVSARELADDGLLDILSSDYVPFSLLFGAILLERFCENMSLPQAIATVTRNPAVQVGLDDRGEISVGKKADIVRFRMDEEVPSVVEVWRDGGRVG